MNIMYENVCVFQKLKRKQKKHMKKSVCVYIHTKNMIDGRY